MGDNTIFILSNSGHLQSLLNPPGNQKASFVTGPLAQAGPDAFLAGSKKHEGSWWLHWRDWLHERSDDEVPAPAALGNARHGADVPAPGTYVFDSIARGACASRRFRGAFGRERPSARKWH
jgi:polyhydroxyalkanoate synthase